MFDLDADEYKDSITLSVGEIVSLCYSSAKYAQNFKTNPDAYIKNIRDELLEAVKASDASKKNLEIIFKNEERIVYKAGEWDDYSYRANSIGVRYKGNWIGIFNFDNIYSVRMIEKTE